MAKQWHLVGHGARLCFDSRRCLLSFVSLERYVELWLSKKNSIVTEETGQNFSADIELRCSMRGRTVGGVR